MGETHGLLTKPGTDLFATSERLGWKSIFVSAQREAPFAYDCSAIDDYLVVVHLTGPVNLERKMDGESIMKTVPVGGVFIMPGGAEFSVSLSGELETVHFYLRKSVIDKALADLPTANMAIRPTFGEQDPLLEQIGLELKNVITAPGSFSDLYADQLANTAALRLISKYSVSQSVFQEQDVDFDPKIKMAIDMMNTDPAYHHSVDSLAAACHLSARHFARRFKTMTNMSPHQYLFKARVTQAQKLLSSTDLSLAAIAYDCGFSNQEHMGRAFKKVIGQTPAQYRRSLFR